MKSLKTVHFNLAGMFGESKLLSDSEQYLNVVSNNKMITRPKIGHFGVLAILS